MNGQLSLVPDLDYWGSYSYKESNDVLLVKVKIAIGKKEVENFAIQFESMSKNSGVMRFAWDKGGGPASILHSNYN
ncbi:MAG: DUF2911 domain-containing protein [Cytophagales bacterium]|nr:DUF2911 domain-containing protein [Cytophagales bacterium]